MVYVVFAIQPSARLQFREQILDPFVVPIIKAVEYMCHKNSRTDPVNFGAVFALNELCEVVKFTSDATHFIVSLRKLENNMKTGPANCNILDCIACAAEILDFAEDERFLIIIATSSPLQVTAEKCRNLIYDNFSMTDFATKFKSENIKVSLILPFGDICTLGSLFPFPGADLSWIKTPDQPNAIVRLTGITAPPDEASEDIIWRGQLSITVSRGETCTNVVVSIDSSKKADLMCLSAWPKKLTLQPYRADPRDIIKQAQTLKCPTVLIKADTSSSKSLENFEGVYQLLCRSGVCASCRFDDKSGIILFPARENCFIGVVFVQMPAFY